MRLRRRHYGIAVGAAIVVMLAAVPFLWWRHAPAVDFSRLRAGPPPADWAARARQEAKWRAEGIERRAAHEYAPLSSISHELQLAVLVSEDIDYFGHGAVDPRAIWEAINEWRHGRRLRGASTISQQLAKILFLSPERTLLRKLGEARLAWWLERELGKRRVLELYLNVVEFGPGLLGAEAASRHYFATGAATLSGEEAAGLAAAIPSPGRDNPSTTTPRWTARRAAILARMQAATWLRRRLSE